MPRNRYTLFQSYKRFLKLSTVEWGPFPGAIQLRVFVGSRSAAICALQISQNRIKRLKQMTKNIETLASGYTIRFEASPHTPAAPAWEGDPAVVP